MTMPSERTRNVLQAGAFLRQLAASQAVPKEVRQEAYRLLRHYPTVSDIEAIAEHEERLKETFRARMDFNSLVRSLLSDAKMRRNKPLRD